MTGAGDGPVPARGEPAGLQAVPAVMGATVFHMTAQNSAKYGELGQYGLICPSNLFL